jgi:hypothetical protein
LEKFDVLGVDLGVKNIAVDNTGTVFSIEGFLRITAASWLVSSNFVLG